MVPARCHSEILIGLVFIAAALAFKVSAVPFHMWTPDVYEGAPTPVTAFFAAAPKVAAIALLLRVVIGPFGELASSWNQIILFISIASMAFAAFAAIGQRNIKRLLAYSSIGHVGYALVGLAAATPEGVRGVLIYMALYMVMTVGAFAAVLAMRQKGQMVEEIADLSGLSKTNPAMAALIGIFMFSMAGIPPFAGFFAKLYVFLAAVNAGLYGLAIVGVLSSVVGAYYYVRIVKVMYFDEPAEALDRPVGREVTAVIAASGIITALFFAYPTPILSGRAGRGGGVVSVTEAERPVAQPTLAASTDTHFKLVRFDEIDSTNVEAKRRATAGEPEFTVVLAATQNAGRGRRGRAWASPRGNLYSSVVLRPECTPIVGAQISFVAALAVSDVACGLVGASAVLCKWPNDVLVNGGKVAGILPGVLGKRHDARLARARGWHQRSTPSGGRWALSFD